jgi:GTP-binding protein Era
MSSPRKSPTSDDLSDLALGRAPEGYRSGFVCIVGRPNVGKSTLLNRILDSKVAITSSRPQTTRNAIRGILTTPQAQIVFVDTPGLHKPRSALGRRLNDVVRTTLTDVDLTLFIVDAAGGFGEGDEYIAHELQQVKTPVLAVLNKIDVASPSNIEAGSRRLEELGGWPLYGVSARTGAGVPELVDEIVSRLPEGPPYYPPDEVTDQPQHRIVAELIREKVLDLTREEVPHSVAVVVDDISTEDDGTVQIAASIYVERDSQKGIVIGKGGRLLKEAGTRARRDIEEFLGSHVFLDLRVKVERDWQSIDDRIARFGYGE